MHASESTGTSDNRLIKLFSILDPMIKKVKADDVRLGMYIQEIRGNWLEHPFWRKSFKLDSQKDFDKLLNCNLDEIWIDSSKGLDVAVNEKAAEPSGAQNAAAEKALRFLVHTGEVIDLDSKTII